LDSALLYQHSTPSPSALLQVSKSWRTAITAWEKSKVLRIAASQQVRYVQTVYEIS
jgi:hypothetical protein